MDVWRCWQPASVFLFLACQSAGGPDAPEGSSSGAGGTASGGTESNDGSGPADQGGGSGQQAAGGSSGSSCQQQWGPTGDAAPDFFADFADDSGFAVVSKTDLLPGATAEPVEEAGAHDGHAIELLVPGDESLGAEDYVGPGAHAIELDFEHPAQLYGRYEFRVRFPECGSDEEMVSGLFTYFNDGSDDDEDGISDNSEIDVEHLCGEPQYLWLSVWTDYQGSPTEEFRKTTRVIDMRDGSVRQTEAGISSYGGLSDAGSIEGLALVDFPDPNAYYQLGFEWEAGHVRYFLVLPEEDSCETREVELWSLEGSDFVPARSAQFLVNLWHPGTHWSAGGPADYPKNDARLAVDWVAIWN